MYQNYETKRAHAQTAQNTQKQLWHSFGTGKIEVFFEKFRNSAMNYEFLQKTLTVKRTLICLMKFSRNKYGQK